MLNFHDILPKNNRVTYKRFSQGHLVYLLEYDLHKSTNYVVVDVFVCRLLRKLAPLLTAKFGKALR